MSEIETYQTATCQKKFATAKKPLQRRSVPSQKKDGKSPTVPDLRATSTSFLNSRCGVGALCLGTNRRCESSSEVDEDATVTQVALDRQLSWAKLAKMRRVGLTA